MREKLAHLNISEYKSLASNSGLTEAAIETTDYYPKWNDLDDYIDAMHGWFQGEFDLTKFNKDDLEEIKREYGSGPVVQSEPIELLLHCFQCARTVTVGALTSEKNLGIAIKNIAWSLNFSMAALYTPWHL